MEPQFPFTLTIDDATVAQFVAMIDAQVFAHHMASILGNLPENRGIEIAIHWQNIPGDNIVWRILV